MNIKIAIDVDEVLVPLLKPMAKYKKIALPKKPKYNYLYREVFNCTEERSQEILHEFYFSDEYILTGRQEIVRGSTELWIEQFYPGLFDDVILTNSFTENEVKKVDVCRALGIGCLIDDSIGTCNECIENGLGALNFVGEEMYPWCEESPISIHGWESYNIQGRE